MGKTKSLIHSNRNSFDIYVLLCFTEGRGELGAAQAVNLKGSRRDIARRYPQTDLLTKQAQRVKQTL